MLAICNIYSKKKMWSKKLKINLTFQRMKFCYWRIHVVLLVYYLFGLVEKSLSSLLSLYIPLLFFVNFLWWRHNFFLNSLDNTVVQACTIPRMSQKFSHIKIYCLMHCCWVIILKYVCMGWPLQ